MVSVAVLIAWFQNFLISTFNFVVDYLQVKQERQFNYGFNHPSVQILFLSSRLDAIQSAIEELLAWYRIIKNLYTLNKEMINQVQF